MKTILITGADGQLGRKLRDLSALFPQFDFLFTDVNQLDITNKDALLRYFELRSIDAIVNCAAYTNVDLAEEEIDLAYQVNEKAPGYLSELAKQKNAIFIHISTDYVFDGTANIAYKEDVATNPVSVYGKSKLAGEDLALEKNKDSIIIRTSWLYSEYGKNFAKTILKFGQERDMLKVVFDQVGTPTYAGSLAHVILEVLNNCIKNGVPNKSGIYHYSDLGVCSWYDFATYLLAQKNIDTPIAAVPSTEFKTRATRPHYSVLDKSKIIHTFNVKIPYWKKACDEMLSKYELS